MVASTCATCRTGCTFSVHATNLTGHCPTTRRSWSPRREAQMATMPTCLHAHWSLLLSNSSHTTRFNCNGYSHRRALDTTPTHTRDADSTCYLARTWLSNFQVDNLDEIPSTTLWHHLSPQQSSTSTTFPTRAPCHLLCTAPPNDDCSPRDDSTGHLPGAAWLQIFSLALVPTIVGFCPRIEHIPETRTHKHKKLVARVAYCAL
jgi:hypothetical protein